MSDHISDEHEPDPIPNDQPAVWELVIEDMKARDVMGRTKYGTPLQPFNGRDSLVDAYQEVLDLAVYLRQKIEENKQSGVVESKPERERRYKDITWWPASMAKDAIFARTIVLMRYDWPDPDEKIYQIGLYDPGRLEPWTDGNNRELMKPDYFTSVNERVVRYINIPESAEYTYKPQEKK